MPARAHPDHVNAIMPTPTSPDLWWQSPYDDAWTLSSLLDAAGPRYGNRPALVSHDGPCVTHAPVAHRLAEGRTVVEIESSLHATATAPPSSVAPDAPAAYLFTSGSTGRPKAVVRSHRSFAHAIYAFADTYTESPDDVMLFSGSPPTSGH